MKKHHEVVRGGLVLVLLVSLFVGCTTAGTPEPAVDSAPETTTQQSVTEESAGEEGSNFNPTGFPIVNEPVTKQFMLRKPAHITNPAEMITLQRYAEMTNVVVEWDVVAADGFSERVNLVMASNSMPDAIIKGVPDITKTSADGSIIDLKELIDDYSVGIKALMEQYAEVKEAALSPDGGMYALPTVNTLDPNRTGHRNLWINQKWLDNLGLALPETVEEYLDVLRAFRDLDANGNGDPTDEIPYVVEYSGDRTPRSDVFLGSWGIPINMGYYANGSHFMSIMDDKVEFLGTSESYKEVLELMNSMWEEKLLDNALYTQSSDVALSKFNSDISGSFGLSSDDLWSEYSSDYIPLPPPQEKATRYSPLLHWAPSMLAPPWLLHGWMKPPKLHCAGLTIFTPKRVLNLSGGFPSN